VAESAATDPTCARHIDHGNYLGTTTVQKALSNLAQSIIAEFVNSAVQSVFSGLGKLLGASLAGGGVTGSGGNQDFWGGITGAGEDVVGGGISEGLFGSGGFLGALGFGNLGLDGGIFGSPVKGFGSLFGFEHGGIVPSAKRRLDGAVGMVSDAARE